MSRTSGWVDHLKQLLESKELGDVIIQVKEEKFEAHKVILETGAGRGSRRADPLSRPPSTWAAAASASLFHDEL